MSIPQRPASGRPRARSSRRAIGWERILVRMVLQAKLPAPVLEHPFSEEIGRKHRFDLAWPDRKVALEIDGGVWMRGGGRHNRGSGFLRDHEKFNLAAMLGWRVLRCTPDDVKNGDALSLIRATLVVE